MALFQSQKVMGYYPTPPVVAEAIARSLVRSGPGLIRAIDPACGEGTALRTITTDLEDQVEWFGIELNQTRARAAEGVFTRVLRTDIRSTRVANQTFSVCLLNPPYDDNLVAVDEAAQRLELYFLQATLRYLAPRGVLVYIIPERRLAGKVAPLLAYHFENIQVFRFPAGEFEPFKQVVIFATKKLKPFRDEAALAPIKAIARGTQIPPDLPAALDAPISVPVVKPATGLLFQSLQVEPEDLLHEIDRHGAPDQLQKRLLPVTTQQRLRPLMPLRKGHLALVLASGHLNNALVADPQSGQRLLVKGRTEKAVTRTESTDENGTRTITERDRLKIVITALDVDSGDLLTLE